MTTTIVFAQGKPETVVLDINGHDKPFEFTDERMTDLCGRRWEIFDEDDETGAHAELHVSDADEALKMSLENFLDSLGGWGEVPVSNNPFKRIENEVYQGYQLGLPEVLTIEHHSASKET